MPIKKRSKVAGLSAKTGQIGPDIPTAKSAASPFTATANTTGSQSFKGADVAALATLRAARKKPVGDVSLGPTEVKEESQAPRNSKYVERLRKRAK